MRSWKCFFLISNPVWMYVNVMLVSKHMIKTYNHFHSCFFFFVCSDAVYVIQSGGKAECQKRQTNSRRKHTRGTIRRTEEWFDQTTKRQTDNKITDRHQKTRWKEREEEKTTEQRMERWREECGGEEVILADRCLKQLCLCVCLCVCVFVCVASFCLKCLIRGLNPVDGVTIQERG